MLNKGYLGALLTPQKTRMFKVDIESTNREGHLLTTYLFFSKLNFLQYFSGSEKEESINHTFRQQSLYLLCALHGKH